MSERTLAVKGTGQASLPPDYIEIPLYLEVRAASYEKAIQLADSKLEQLRGCLSTNGFKKSDLKTTDFTVDTDYESVKNENGDYVRVFRGYVVRHHLKLGFPLNNKRLGAVLQSLSECPAHPEFSVRYKLKDEEQLKSLILQDAVANATQQAMILAKAAGVTLGDVLSIQYDWTNISFQPRELMFNETTQYSVANIDLQPEDISASDMVTMVWAIH